MQKLGHMHLNPFRDHHPSPPKDWHRPFDPLTIDPSNDYFSQIPDGPAGLKVMSDKIARAKTQKRPEYPKGEE
jgi:hypothetical protein